MKSSYKNIQQFKEAYQKDTGVLITDSQAEEYYERLSQLADIILSVALQEYRREKRLESEPNGFSLEEDEGTFSCSICYKSISGDQTWWDSFGLRCKDCQNNIQNSVIPVEICKDRNIWFKDWQLKSDFKIHPQTAKKLVRENILHPRELKDEKGNIYFKVYMMKENQNFLKKYKNKSSNRTEPLFVDKNGEIVF